MAKIFARVSKVPFFSVFAIAILLAAIGEQFPFSNFPMYSNFEPNAQVLYLADQDGRAIPSKMHFRTSTSKIKKSYKSALKKVCEPTGASIKDATGPQKETAAREVLERVVTRSRTKRAPRFPAGIERLTLRQHLLVLKDGEFVEEKHLLGEIPFLEDDRDAVR